jgi:hypothetical protein
MKQLYPETRGLRKTLFLFLFIVTILQSGAQQVSGIITDYNSFWKTSTTNINAIKPADSHNLLAFTYNGVQYSTGVNDQLLNSRGENFVAGDFWALPLAGMTGTINANTKVGWGEMKDGVHNGIGSLLLPQMNINLYLTDGIKGLDLGTCIANLPAGNMTFFVNNIKPQDIGDGFPDILVTQVADPSGSDRYSFIDSTGAIVGISKNIMFSSISPVGNWTADFYQPLGSLLTLIPGFTNTDRPLRLWAADLSEFGITAANYLSVHKFKVELSGNSDMAFAAYNNRTLTLSSTLPVKLTDFTGKKASTGTLLNWTTHTEENSDVFTIERSPDNNSFVSIGSVNASGNTTIAQYYSFADKKPFAGANYYRLKMIDKDGTFIYSPVVKLQFSELPNSAYLFPNPCKDELIIVHPADKGGRVSIYSSAGLLVRSTNAFNSKQTQINVSGLSKGIYLAVWQNGNERMSMTFAKD